MKRAFTYGLKIGLLCFICVLILFASGCKSYAQMGETEAEGRRRHIRNLRLAQQQLMEDIDAFLLLDRPCGLSEKRIP